MKAPLPPNEEQRLEALAQYKILDTPKDKAFDDLTRLAAYICGTPISLITLVDAERQWFKSKVGLEASQTPRNVAFCAHAILQPDPFIIPDATKDERFATNPLVTSDPYIRFYAGVPLITPEKQAIGTLCIIDQVPRTLTPEQLEALQILSRQTIQQLELRRNLANLTLQVSERQRAGKKRRRFFKRIAGGIGLASVILALVGGVSYQSLTKLIETNNLAAQTQERLTKLEELLSQVKDAETGQRGYLLTGDDRYLEPYKTAIANLNQEIKALKKLAANYPNKQKQLDALESLIKNKLAELKGVIDLRNGQGFEAALDLVRTNLGKKIMDDIRREIQQLENEEKAILKQQLTDAQVSTRRAIFTLFGGLFLTFLILGLVYYLIYREIKERQWVEEALNKERNFISAVLDTSSALVVVLDRFGQIIRFNRACEQITGYSFNEVRGRHFWNLFLIPEEVEPVKAIFAELQADQFSSENENYWVTRDGHRRLIAWSNTALLDSQGLVEYVIGTGIDITDRKQAEEALIASETKYRLVVDSLKEVIFQTDIARRLTFLNPAWTDITGFSVSQSLGKRFLDFFHSDDFQLHEEKFLTLIEGQTEDCRYSVRCKTKRGDVAQVEVYAHRTLADDGTLLGISGTLNDITERKRREQHLKAETATTRVLAEANTLSEAIPNILQAICESLGWEHGEFWSVDSTVKELRCMESWHREFLQVSEFEAATAQLSLVLGEGLPGRVWASGEPSWMSNVVENPDFLRGELAAKAGLYTAFAFPIQAGDETLGAMSFFSREIQPPDTDLLKMMGAIGSQIGQFIKRKQAEEELQRQHLILQSELNQAAEYVRSRLPRPLTGRVTTQALFIPSLQLGGDAFDYYWLDADHLAIYLLDVAGHGVRSALLSVSVLNVLRSQSLPNTNFYQPSAVLRGLNHVFQMSETGDDYFTIWYGVYNPVKRQLVYACAGHPPALLLSEETFCPVRQAMPVGSIFSSTTPVKQLGAQGIPIGMLPESDVDDDWCEIPADSTLYLFSDGVYEIHQHNGKIWGLNSFIDLLPDYQNKNFIKLEDLLDQIQFATATRAFDDDFSLLKIDFN